MPIPDPLRSPIYESGGLIQQCDACSWAQCGHRSELVYCPLCSQTLTGPVAISFGGTVVMKLGNNIEIYGRGGEFVLLERIDLAEIIQFMCRHAEDLRTGTPVVDISKPRRVAHRKELRGHFFSGE